MAIAIICAVIAVLLIAAMAILPPGGGKLPEYRDSSGDILHNSISERVKLDIDGGELGLILLAKDADAPVLMVCGGGPGIPQYLVEYLYPSVLADEFVVCYWDYRGTGTSFDSGADPREMTTGRYVSDALAVADYLSQRFSQEKIYIMGHSFGTYIALKTVQSSPEKFVCYIAMSQICDQRQSEYLAFDYMKQQYEDRGDKKMAARFGEYDIRSSEEDYNSYFFSGLRDKAMHDLGVGTARDRRSVISGLFFPSLRCKAYTPAERINLWRGKASSSEFPVDDEAIRFNAFTDAESIDIPVYFIVGKYDYTCCASLQQEYYEAVNAPRKAIYIFEDSAHSPLYEQPEKASEILGEIKQAAGE